MSGISTETTASGELAAPTVSQSPADVDVNEQVADDELTEPPVDETSPESAVVTVETNDASATTELDDAQAESAAKAAVDDASSSDEMVAKPEENGVPTVQAEDTMLTEPETNDIALDSALIESAAELAANESPQSESTQLDEHASGQALLTDASSTEPTECSESTELAVHEPARSEEPNEELVDETSSEWAVAEVAKNNTLASTESDDGPVQPAENGSSAESNIEEILAADDMPSVQPTVMEEPEPMQPGVQGCSAEAATAIDAPSSEEMVHDAPATSEENDAWSSEREEVAELETNDVAQDSPMAEWPAEPIATDYSVEPTANESPRSESAQLDACASVQTLLNDCSSTERTARGESPEEVVCELKIKILDESTVPDAFAEPAMTSASQAESMTLGASAEQTMYDESPPTDAMDVSLIANDADLTAQLSTDASFCARPTAEKISPENLHNSHDLPPAEHTFAEPSVDTMVQNASINHGDTSTVPPACEVPSEGQVSDVSSWSAEPAVIDRSIDSPSELEESEYDRPVETYRTEPAELGAFNESVTIDVEATIVGDAAAEQVADDSSSAELTALDTPSAPEWSNHQVVKTMRGSSAEPPTIDESVVLGFATTEASTASSANKEPASSTACNPLTNSEMKNDAGDVPCSVDGGSTTAQPMNDRCVNKSTANASLAGSPASEMSAESRVNVAASSAEPMRTEPNMKADPYVDVSTTRRSPASVMRSSLDSSTRSPRTPVVAPSDTDSQRTTMGVCFALVIVLLAVAFCLIAPGQRLATPKPWISKSKARTTGRAVVSWPPWIPAVTRKVAAKQEDDPVEWPVDRTRIRRARRRKTSRRDGLR